MFVIVSSGGSVQRPVQDSVSPFVEPRRREFAAEGHTVAPRIKPTVVSRPPTEDRLVEHAHSSDATASAPRSSRRPRGILPSRTAYLITENTADAEDAARSADEGVAHVHASAAQHHFASLLRSSPTRRATERRGGGPLARTSPARHPLNYVPQLPSERRSVYPQKKALAPERRTSSSPHLSRLTRTDRLVLLSPATCSTSPGDGRVLLAQAPDE